MIKLRAVAIIAGILGILGGPWIIYDNYSSASWPTVEGIVQKSTVSRTPHNWRVELSYTYSLAGRNFRGYLYRAGGSLVDSEEEATRIADSYPVGSPVTVHCDPKKPAHAALKTGLEPRDAFLPLLGVAGLTYGFWPRRKNVRP